MRGKGIIGGLAGCAAVAFVLGFAAGPAAASVDGEEPAGEAGLDPTGAPYLCELIGQAARAHGLPEPFFARLIWKESRFDIGAVSPMGALGVAQFMPATAALRGLEDPLDPAQAIPASAALLAELRDEFGNLGLAAAAYNAGSGRVSRWLAGSSGLPGETREYVQWITARPAGWFREAGREAEPRPLAADRGFEEACREMPVIATRAEPRPPWGVAVAGGSSRRGAVIAYERLRRRIPSLMDSAQLHIVRRARASGGRSGPRGSPPRRAPRRSGSAPASAAWARPA